MTYRLHHIHLICSDLEEMIAFFTQSLGAELLERKKFLNTDGASLNLNGTIVNVQIAPEGQNVRDSSPLPQCGYDHICLGVENIEKAYKELIGKGHVFSMPPKDVGKIKIAFFNGPDNLAIELLQPLG